MTGKDIFNNLQNIDDKFIIAAAPYAPVRNRLSRTKFKYFATAACIAVAASMVLGLFAVLQYFNRPSLPIPTVPAESESGSEQISHLTDTFNSEQHTFESNTEVSVPVPGAMGKNPV